MILLDTSVLIDALTGSQRLGPSLRSAIGSGNRIRIPSLELFEWLRGPRTMSELALQEALFPSTKPFASDRPRRCGRLPCPQLSDVPGRAKLISP